VSGFAKAVVLASMKGATMHTTLAAKGQTTLPSAIRKQLGLTAGDQLSVIVQHWIARRRRPRHTDG
jgi:AbrB family looped-hinge helix DNA binding protein